MRRILRDRKVFDEGVGRLFNTPELVAEGDVKYALIQPSAAMARALGSPGLPCCTLAAPISVGDKKLGVLVLETMQGPVKFAEGELPFLQTIADLIALAIDRARLIQQADVCREARQAERMRSEVMAMLSHELRLPLTAIQGYSSALLLDEVQWSEEKRVEFLHLIDEECHNMQVMLKNCSISSLIDIDQLTIERQPVRLPHIAAEAAREVQQRTDRHHSWSIFPPIFHCWKPTHAGSNRSSEISSITPSSTLPRRADRYPGERCDPVMWW